MSVSHSSLPLLTEQDIKRFWAKVDVKGLNECWPWCGTSNKRNYGIFRVCKNGKKNNVYAHRIAYGLQKQEDPINYLIRHICDNPPCCNPRHLLKGTDWDNVHDAVLKGRMTGPRSGINHIRGEAHWTRTPEGRERSRLHLITVVRAHGERQHSAKLTENKVREARVKYADGVNINRLAIEYGISWFCMMKVVRQITWKHVKD